MVIVRIKSKAINVIKSNVRSNIQPCGSPQLKSFTKCAEHIIAFVDVSGNT